MTNKRPEYVYTYLVSFLLFVVGLSIAIGVSIVVFTAVCLVLGGGIIAAVCMLLGYILIHLVRRFVTLLTKEAVSKDRHARRQHLDVFEEPAISGRLQDIDVSAFPDTGAAANFISLPHAQRNGLTIDEDFGKRVEVGNSSTIRVVGTAKLPFSFAGETTKHDLTFLILHKSVHDIILGSSFLRASKTFTQFAHRISRKMRVGNRIHSVHFLGSQQYVNGMANGVSVDAVPDTGADVSVMSANFAVANGFEINDEERDRISLGFADGSTARACGVVKDVAWRFGADKQTHLTDVYVLSTLPVDLVLGYDFLCQTAAFIEHEGDFWHVEDLERENDCLRLCIIRRLKRATAKSTGGDLSAHTKETHLLSAVELYREAKEHAKAQGLSDDETTRFLEPYVDRWVFATTTQPNVRPTDESNSVGGFKIGKWRIKLQKASSGWEVDCKSVKC